MLRENYGPTFTKFSLPINVKEQSLTRAIYKSGGYKTLITISFALLTFFATAQSKANKELKRFLKSNQLDTFVLIKSGCSSCKISYDVTDKVVDTVTIWLLYKKNGRQLLTTFSDTSHTRKIADIETDIFKVISNNRHLLSTKDKYYQEEILLKFKPPCLVTFPYENIELKYGQFTYKHTLVERKMDECGIEITNEDWFKFEVEILKLVDNLKA